MHGARWSIAWELRIEEVFCSGKEVYYAFGLKNSNISFKAAVNDFLRNTFVTKNIGIW
uniref:Uncharacterized protein n=2 Tax=Musa acuminata subsp. malaccensis TaxID=214687 RepID=A0A804IJZ5_MUSAM